MKRLLFASLVISSLFVLVQCSKKDMASSPGSPNSVTKLQYSDSIFYLNKDQSSYAIYPMGNRPKGTYSVHPDNLDIDPSTGKLMIRAEDKDNNSLTGLWYKIKFTPEVAGKEDSTYILISGINYVDKYYYLNSTDSIIHPIYNGDPAKAVPGGVYNIGNEDLPINPANGQININMLKRMDFFKGSSFKDVTIRYKIYDNSGAVENSLRIILYYYPSWNEVPTKVSEIMQSHQQLTFGFPLAAVQLAPKSFTGDLPSYFNDFNLKDYATWKPRPPCVVIVGN
jgi:hypothetical protein